MENYVKDTPRIEVKFIDNDTEETLIEIKDRNWMNVGELFTNNIVNSIIQNELKHVNKPDEILVIAVGRFKKK